MSYVGVERKRRYLKEAFSHYLSPQVAKKILQDPERLRLGGQRVQATVLFSDLAGFTEMSERLEPEEVVIGHDTLHDGDDEDHLQIQWYPG